LAPRKKGTVLEGERGSRTWTETRLGLKRNGWKKRENKNGGEKKGKKKTIVVFKASICLEKRDHAPGETKTERKSKEKKSFCHFNEKARRFSGSKRSGCCNSGHAGKIKTMRRKARTFAIRGKGRTVSGCG